MKKIIIPIFIFLVDRVIFPIFVIAFLLVFFTWYVICFIPYFVWNFKLLPFKEFFTFEGDYIFSGINSGYDFFKQLFTIGINE